LTELPLFPLSGVLVPHGRMPLRIFEPRYLDLVRETLRNDGMFGNVWIRRGSEVAQRGRASPELGDYGTAARIVDWDKLPDGLLGVTICGVNRFELFETEIRADGLQVGQVVHQPAPVETRMREEWQTLLDVLRSLERHPHVKRMKLKVDYNDAWQVGYTLVQLLPMEESLKYDMLGMESIDELMRELDALLSRVSGED